MRLRRQATLLIVWLSIGACASHPKAPETPAPAPQFDASYDWHVLLVAPFGSLYKDVPLPRYEVIVLDGQAQGSPAECSGIDQAAPRFLSQVPAELLLCFRHDHLVRIEATVMLLAADAPKILADACALWKRNASVTAPPTGTLEAPEAAGACRGRDGEVDFYGRLEQETDLDADRAFLPYTITLDVHDPS